MKLKMLSFILLTFLLVNPVALSEEFEVSVNVSPKSVDVPPFGIADFDIIIQNMGENKDIYGITVDGIPEEWYSLSHESIELDAGDSETVYLFVTPYHVKREAFTVTVSVVGQSSDSDTFILNIIPDHEILVSLPKQVSSCLCEEDEVTIVVDNVGKYDEDIVLTLSGDAVDIVELELRGFTLEPEQRKEVPLKIVSICGQEERSYSLEVEAKSMSSYAKSTASSRIDKIKCYDFEAYYPEEVSACAGVLTTFEIEIQNTGIKEDTFEIEIEVLNFSDVMTLAPGESRIINVSAKQDEYGTYDIEFVVRSSFFEKIGIVKFIAERCYAVDLEVDEPEISVQSGIGRLTKPIVTNIGTRKDKFTVTTDVGWALIKPSELDIDPDETKDVYVYYSPEYGLTGTFDVILTAQSDNSKDEETVMVNIVEGVTTTTVENVTTTIPETTTTVENVTTTIPEIPFIPTGLLTRVLKSRLFLSSIIGIVAALIIVGLLYVLVMGG